MLRFGENVGQNCEVNSLPWSEMEDHALNWIRQPIQWTMIYPATNRVNGYISGGTYTTMPDRKYTYPENKTKQVE